MNTTVDVTLGPHFVLAMKTNKFDKDWSKHCLFFSSLSITDIIFVIFHFLLIHRQKSFTLTLCCFAVILQLIYLCLRVQHLCTVAGIGVAFPQWPMTILCIMYVSRYTGIPAYNSCPNFSMNINLKLICCQKN